MWVTEEELWESRSDLKRFKTLRSIYCPFPQQEILKPAVRAITFKLDLWGKFLHTDGGAYLSPMLLLFLSLYPISFVVDVQRRCTVDNWLLTMNLYLLLGEMKTLVI